ncbi:hypothetical protein AAFM46_08195 [Arthrobacter sp. TMP15]|uniref:hypothetical protein n=1 Tax=Arthrobacter sp. TMP15 TaxID=3140789 RepID=UPI0031BBAAE5
MKQSTQVPQRPWRVGPLPALAAAVVIFLLSGCATQTLEPLDVSDVQVLTVAERFSVDTDGTYHGWWDQSQLPGKPTNLIIFSTKQNKVIQRIGTPPELTADNYSFLRSSRWANNVIIVLDPARNRTLETFAVDLDGNPTTGPVRVITIDGYEGWWNSTPENGDLRRLPNETVAVNTRSNKVVDGYNRTTKSTKISYTVHPNPAWPQESVIIIDTATNKIVDSFPVDENGNPKN